MKKRTSISSAERLERIAFFVDSHKSITIHEIASEFSVGLTTARRDLDALAEQGRVQRVHGGAKALSKAPPEPPVMSRTLEQVEEKRRIGRIAADLVQDGETVFLGAGTTVMEVAACLCSRGSLTVVTNSLLVVNAMNNAPHINLVGLGGYYRYTERSFVGHITEQALADVRATKVIMGVRAIDIDQGLTEEFPPEAATNRAIFNIGQQVILVADHTKFGRVAAAFIAPVTAADVIVTDSATPGEYIKALQAKGIRAITE